MRFLEQLRWKFSAFMRGRYGMDKLSMHLYYAALLLWLISALGKVRIASILYTAAAVFAIYRCFSRNIGKRMQELQKYEKACQKMRGMRSVWKARWRDRKTHRYFTCKCGKTLRVPKGKGKIEISCPFCGAKRIRRT